MLTRFVVGGLIYMGIEVLWDNTSHRSMGLVGGLAFVLCGYYIGLPRVLMSFLMATTIVTLELIAGLIWNRDHSIWDYRNMPLNYKGQICLTYYLIWAVLMPFVIVWLDNLLR